MSIFYQGVSRLSLEDCTQYLEKAAERDFTFALWIAPDAAAERRALAALHASRETNGATSDDGQSAR